MSEPLTLEQLNEALKRTTDDIVETLTARSQAVENKLDAIELSTKLTLTRIEGKLDAALGLDLKVSELEKRIARLEKKHGLHV